MQMQHRAHLGFGDPWGLRPISLSRRDDSTSKKDLTVKTLLEGHGPLRPGLSKAQRRAAAKLLVIIRTLMEDRGIGDIYDRRVSPKVRTVWLSLLEGGVLRELPVAELARQWPLLGPLQRTRACGTSPCSAAPAASWSKSRQIRRSDVRAICGRIAEGDSSSTRKHDIPK